ncbi:MAG: Holliday junction resolvase RuvX [Candidatus Izemoplasmataceae bacterium]
MRVLGLDLGNRSLGVALSDPEGFLARPFETFKFEDKAFDQAIDYTVQLIKDKKIEKVVLGYPKNMDGSLGDQAKITLAFKEQLEQLINVEVILFDERLSSKMASNMMISQKLSRKKRKTNIDNMAATVILQGYLDRT